MIHSFQSNRLLLAVLAVMAIILVGPVTVEATAYHSGGASLTPYENTMQYLVDQAKSLSDQSQGSDRSTAEIGAKIKALHGKIEISTQPICDSWSVNGTTGACSSNDGASYSMTGQSRPTTAEIVSDMRDIRSLLSKHNSGNYCSVPTANNWSSVKPGLACLHKILSGEQETSSSYNPGSSVICRSCSSSSYYGNPTTDGSIGNVSDVLKAVEVRIKQMQVISPHGGSGQGAPYSEPTPSTRDPIPSSDASGGDGGNSAVSDPDDIKALRNLLEIVLERIEELLASR